MAAKVKSKKVTSLVSSKAKAPEPEVITNLPSKVLGVMLGAFRKSLKSWKNAGLAMLDWAADSMSQHAGDLSDHDVEAFVNVVQEEYGRDWNTAKSKEKARSNWRKIIQARRMLAAARPEVKRSVQDCHREFVLTLARGLLAGKTTKQAIDYARGKHAKGKPATPEQLEKQAWGRVRAALQNLYAHGKPAARKAAVAAAEVLNPQWDLPAELKKAAAKKS